MLIPNAILLIHDDQRSKAFLTSFTNRDQTYDFLLSLWMTCKRNKVSIFHLSFYTVLFLIKKLTYDELCDMLKTNYSYDLRANSLNSVSSDVS